MIQAPNLDGVRTGLHHWWPRDAEQLVSTLAERWSAPLPDPFAFDLAIVPGPGFQRWVSQQLASTGASAGVCAGVEFVSGGAFWRRLLGDDDPWAPDRLTWLLVEIVAATAEPGLEQLRRHLAAAREPWTACRRIARQFASYALYRPAMLASWAAGNDAGPTGSALAEEAWQPCLWRLAAARIGYHPVAGRERLLDHLRAAPAPGVPARVAVLAPPRVSDGSLGVWAALATWHQVDVLILTPSPSRVPVPGHAAPLRRSACAVVPGHPLNESLAIVRDEISLLAPRPAPHVPPPQPLRPDTLLGWLQQDLADDVTRGGRVLAAGDRSVGVHLSHGLDRQVEVLREVLAGLFDADPSLEPRDVVIVTPQVDAVASLVSAAFGLSAAPGVHPGHGFRVQVADRSIAQVNPLVTLLLELLRLPDSRVEASRLVDLCAQGSVARKFSFTPDSQERLARLVGQSGVRWGLSAAARERFGLGSFAQNTWLAGLQRMLLGVALSEQEGVWVRTVLPLDDVESSDIELIGGLTELVGRLSRFIADIDRPTTVAGWIERCRAGLTSLIDPPAEEQWQLNDLWTGLNRLAEQADRGSATLTRHGLIRAVEDEFGNTPARGGFGNGSAIVCGPASLRHVPHRVVILLGWDAERFPRSGRRHGDDLLRLSPLVGDPAPTLEDRQTLLDAVHATRESLIVIARARSEATNEAVPLAAPILELLDTLNATAATLGGTPAGRAVTIQHPLQPFDSRYFEPSAEPVHPRLTSYDPTAFAGARAALEPPVQGAGRHHLDPLPPPDLSGGLGLDDLTAFFTHPVRALLKQRAGLRLGDSPAVSESIPIALDHLQRWQIGTRMLGELRAGREAEELRVAEWLRGSVPPAELGRAALTSILNDAQKTLKGIPAAAAEPSVVHDLHSLVPVADGAGVWLTGRLATHGDTLLAVEFSGLQPRHRLVAWLRLLALAATEPGPWRAVVIGRGFASTLTAPGPDTARALLGRYVSLYSLGLTRPLPATPRVCETWASLRARGVDPKGSPGELKRSWEWDRDASWQVFFALIADVLEPRTDQVRLPAPTPGEALLVGALAELIWAPLLAHEQRRGR